MAELGYTVAGDAKHPAVVFLHGFMGSAADWQEMAAVLENRFYCVAVDLPGHGASLGLPTAIYTMEGASKSLFGLLADLGVRRQTLAGYSMGGRLALYFALRHPERCAGLLLESASPGLEGPTERKARRKTDEAKARRLESEDFGEFLEDWYGQPLFAPLARDEELLGQTIRARKRNDPAELARALRGMGTGSQPSLWGELAGLEVPALAVAGELDEKFVGIARRMEAKNPAVRPAVVSGAGHNVHAEAPDEYLSLLRGFLGAA